MDRSNTLRRTASKSRRFVAAAATAFAASCAAAPPSPADARNALRQRLDRGSETRLRLAQFEKTDGRSMEVMGLKAYELMFTATVEFTQDSLFAVGGSSTVFGASLDGRVNEITTAPYQKRSGNFLRDFSLDFNSLRPARRFDILRLLGHVAFERRESGWVPTGTTFTVAHVDGDDRPERAEKLQKQKNHLKVLEDLMAQHGTNFRGAGREAMTGYIDSDGDPNGRIGGYWSFLHVAAVNGYKDLVELLLARGADINGGRDDGTPLYWAVAGGQPAVALYLIEKGADINRAKSGGWTPLDVAESQLDPQDPVARAVMSALTSRGAKKKS